jgi:hypothetical protein
MLRNFSEKNAVILLHILLDGLFIGQVGSKEIKTFAKELDLLAIGDQELLLGVVLDLDLVVVW